MAPQPFTPAWLAGSPEATALLDLGFRSPEARVQAVERAASRAIHPAVLASLSTTHPAQERSLQALATPGSAVVVTGQQAGLFGGPLYTLYKAAAAIVNARALSAESGRPVVPLFWLQNEDHDYDEIAACTLLASDGTLVSVRSEGLPDETDRPIAQRHLGEDVLSALELAAEALGHHSDSEPALALLRHCWQPGRSPDAAFRAWIEALFAPHGLLVVDPSHPDLAAAAAPVHRRAIEDAVAVGALLETRAEALRSAGFAVQVHVRPESPLSFLHPDGPTGPRYRVEPDGDRLRLCGTDRTVGPEALATGPWTTSALLRPILQDSWLPTVAYVGGPGEIAYFAQLPPLYAHFDLPMPLIVPRARFRVVDSASSRLLDQLGLDLPSLDQDPDTLRAQVAQIPAGLPNPSVLAEDLLRELPARLAAFSADSSRIDPSLSTAATKTEQAIRSALGKLTDRYQQALVRRDQISVDRLERLLARLQPLGAPQERVHSWPSYAARYGVSGFVDHVLDATRPFDGSLQELRP